MENDQPIVKLLKLNHSDVLLLQQSLKNKIKMEIDPLADTLEDSAGNLETRHRVRPKPLGKEFKKQLSARVDRIEQLLELLLNNSDEVVNEDSGEDYEDTNDTPDNNEVFLESPPRTSKAPATKVPKIVVLKENELMSEHEEREKTRAKQDMIKKKFESQKRMAQQVRQDQYPSQLQELAKQFPFQSVDALIQFNDEVYMNEELRNKLIELLTFMKEKLPKTFNRGVNAIIEISVGRFLNWTGLNDKINLSSLPLFSEILPEIWYPSLSVADYQQLITSDLRKKAKMNYSLHLSSKRALTGSD